MFELPKDIARNIYHDDDETKRDQSTFTTFIAQFKTLILPKPKITNHLFSTYIFHHLPFNKKSVHALGPYFLPHSTHLRYILAHTMR